ncbi:MAG: glycosyltransferase, partial [Verrucomicrobiota bacterium]|nr:glycosyltransferase [Verrucomicrobiota bacterium]
MLRVAYLFERFPSFGQTFCYREVAELIRQGAEVSIFSIRKPKNEPAQDWDPAVVRRVFYLPEEAELVKEVDQAIRRRELPDPAIRALKEWGRNADFLRLYDAAFVGLRLRNAGITRVHAHFAGMAARTAYWISRFFGIDFSVTAHANDIFAPREFIVTLDEIFDAAAAIVTVSDFSVRQLTEQFPRAAAKIQRVYNGIDPAAFRLADFASESPVIISVGRLIEKKGFADLIAACAGLKQRGVHFRSEIIGEGPLEPQL